MTANKESFKFSKEFLEYFDDVSEMEKGEFHKHDVCFATCSLEITDEVIAEFPEMAKYKGCTVSQEGTHSYSWGWDSYDSVKMYRTVYKETQASHEFWQLMSHLNSEDNDMAFEFAKKHFPDTETLQEVFSE